MGGPGWRARVRGVESGSERVATRLLIGLDLLALLLVGVAVARPVGPAWWVWLAGAGFLVGWVIVRLRVRVVGAPMEARGWWPGGVAGLVLLVLYGAVVLTSDAGMWLAFPVMLLQLHLLGARGGVAAVTLTTVATVTLGATLRGESGLGYVLGPVVGALVAVASVVGLESLARVIADRQRAMDELRQAQQQLLDVERERSRAQERAHLARDIHDTLAQDFAAIDLHLRRVAAALDADSPAMPGIVLARQATAEGLAQARSFVAGEPGHQVAGSVVDAIRRVAERAEAASGGRTTIEVRSVGVEAALPAFVATELVRMLQSALSNVVRHAAADSAAVTLTWDADRVLLDVADDGAGFQPDQPDVSSGFGLAALRARVSELDGTLGIESVPGEGTVIAISLPLNLEHQ